MRLLRDARAACRHGITSAGAVLRRIERLPMAGLDAITHGRPVLVVAPHPDDESLGCGGLIAAMAAHGLDAHVLVLTDGAASHPRSRRYPPARLRALREQETREAIEQLGLAGDRVRFLGLPDGAGPLSGRPAHAAAQRLVEHARAVGAGTICATWIHDPHPDHVAAALLGRMAARAVGARLLSYPVWGWTLPQRRWLPAEPVAGFRLDIAAQLPAKRAAIACHRSQTTALIDDDPAGFRLLDEVLDIFARPFEVFLHDQGATP